MEKLPSNRKKLLAVLGSGRGRHLLRPPGGEGRETKHVDSSIFAVSVYSFDEGDSRSYTSTSFSLLLSKPSAGMTFIFCFLPTPFLSTKVTQLCWFPPATSCGWCVVVIFFPPSLLRPFNAQHMLSVCVFRWMFVWVLCLCSNYSFFCEASSPLKVNRYPHQVLDFWLPQFLVLHCCLFSDSSRIAEIITFAHLFLSHLDPTASCGCHCFHRCLLS